MARCKHLQFVVKGTSFAIYWEKLDSNQRPSAPIVKEPFVLFGEW